MATATRTIRDISREIRELHDLHGEPCDEYDPGTPFPTIDRDAPDPEPRWWTVYVVFGTSEGLYLHVEGVNYDGDLTTYFLGKTLDCSREKWDELYRFAGALSWKLNDWR